MKTCCYVTTPATHEAPAVYCSERPGKGGYCRRHAARLEKINAARFSGICCRLIDSLDGSVQACSKAVTPGAQWPGADEYDDDADWCDECLATLVTPKPEAP